MVEKKLIGLYFDAKGLKELDNLRKSKYQSMSRSALITFILANFLERERKLTLEEKLNAN